MSLRKSWRGEELVLLQRIKIKSILISFCIMICSCKNSFILTALEDKNSHSRSCGATSSCVSKTEKNDHEEGGDEATPVSLSQPLNLTYDYESYVGAPTLGLAWEYGEVLGTSIRSQEVLVFSDSFTCSGQPVFSIAVPANQTSFRLDRFKSAALRGKLSFKIKASFANGEALESDCGVTPNEVENYAAVYSNPTDNITWNDLNNDAFLKSGDLNGDGKADIITYGTYDSGSKGLLIIRFSKPDSLGSDVRFFTHPTVLSGALIVVTDLTGDGKDELVVAIGSDFFLLPGSSDSPANGTIAGAFRSYDLPDHVSAYDYQVDFNNDGRKEMLYRSATGLVLIEGRSVLPASGPLDHKAYDYEANSDHCNDVDVIDWNLDGYTDFVCYAIYSDYNAMGAGSIIILPGGVTLPDSGNITAQLRRYYGSTTYQYVGYHAGGGSNDSRLHDITGDGYPEIITSFHQYGSGNGEGSVNIVIGGATFPNSGAISGLGGRGRTYTGQNNNNNLGEGIQIADVTGDGINDIISSFYSADDDGTGSPDGAIFLIPGGPILPASDAIQNGPGFTYLGNDGEMAGYGGSLTVSDVDNDGIADIFLSGSLSNTSAANAGGAYLLLGGLPPASGRLQTIADRYWHGEASGHTLYAQLADLNSDGVKEIVAGSAVFSSNRGRIYVFDHTKASGSVLTGSKYYTGATTSDRLGSSISLTDINQDGLLDLVSVYTVGAGIVHIIPGTDPMPASAAITSVGTTFAGVNADDKLGTSLRTADLNGDGYTDLFSMNGVADSGGTDRGVFYVIEGKATGLPDTMYRYYGQHDNDKIGDFWKWALNYKLEDINNDGTKDFIVGDSATSPNGIAGAGSIFILPGGTFPASGPLNGWIRLDGVNAGDGLGNNLNVQDLDGDGHVDFLAFRNDGHRFFRDGSETGEIDLVAQPTFYFNAPGDIGTNFTTIDLTGDGKLDILGLVEGDFHAGTANGAVIVQPFEFISVASE